LINWHEDGQDDEIMQGALIFLLNLCQRTIPCET